MEYKLEDICIKVTDGSHFSPKDCKSGNIPMLSVKDMMEYGFNYKNCKHISEEDFEIMLRQDCVPKKDDILVAKDGSYLKEIFVNKVENKKAILSSIAIFRVNKDLVLPHYLCYLLKSPKVFNYAKNNCVSGSALPRIILKAFKDIKLNIPSIEIQKKVEKILLTIDSKIELNNKINDNLQKLSQELYKRWFVDFKFPNETGKPYKSSGGKMVDSELGLIPEGWGVSKLSQIIKRNNKKIKKYADWENQKLIDLSVMPQFSISIYDYNYGSMVNSNVFELSKGDILYGSIRPYFGKVGVSPIDGVVTGTVYNYVANKNEYYEYLLLLTSSNEFIDFTIKLSKGTKMPVISWSDFITYKIVITNNNVMNKFSELVKPNIQSIIANINQNYELKVLRDILLSKLMNGNIDLENIRM